MSANLSEEKFSQRCLAHTPDSGPINEERRLSHFSQQIWMFSEIRNDNQMRNKQFPYDDTQNFSKFLQGNCDYGMPLEMILKKLLSALSVDNYKIDRSAS